MQIRLPLACLAILVYALYHYSRKARMRTYATKVFELLTMAGTIHVAAAVVTEFTVNNRSAVPEWFNLGWHVIFLVSLTLTIGLLYYYLLVCVELSVGRRKPAEFFAECIVCAAGIAAEILLPIEYVDTPEGSYSLGAKAYALYAVVIYTMVMLLWNLVRYHKQIAPAFAGVYAASAGIFVIVSVVQILCPYMLLTGFAITMIIIGMLLHTADSHLYVDPRTGLYNENGCREIMRELQMSNTEVRACIYVFFGDSLRVTEAMTGICQQIHRGNSRIVCGSPSDNVLMIFPPVGKRQLLNRTDALPMPVEVPGVRYLSDTMRFDDKKDMEEIFRSVLEYKQRCEENLLHRDDLTGLLRRAGYVRQVNRLIEKEHSFAFIMLDIDDFKGINDNYGHQIGDEVLRSAAQVFRAHLGEQALICRMGGDEFSMLLLDETRPEAVRKAIAGFTKALDQLPLSDGRILPVHLSVGVKLYRPGEAASSFDKLYLESDAALYKAKHLGKNRVELLN